MNQYLTRTVIAIATGAGIASCAAAQTDVESMRPTAQSASASQGNRVTDKQIPINQRFHTLDEYLAWLHKTAAPADRPWYKEIRPGVYEVQTAGNLHLDVPSNEKRVFTRAELEKKFGFSK